jgi:hypothetical protein
MSENRFIFIFSFGLMRFLKLTDAPKSADRALPEEFHFDAKHHP